MIDDVERSANDSRQGRRKKIAFAEDGAIFEGYVGGIEGIRQGTSNPIETLPDDVRNSPDVSSPCTQSVASRRRQRPCSVLSSADAYTALTEAGDYGDPVWSMSGLVGGEII